MTTADERRFNEVERRVGNLEQRTSDIGVLNNEIRNIWKAIEGLRSDLHDAETTLGEELNSVRRALYTAALSVAGGVFITALTILQVFR